MYFTSYPIASEALKIFLECEHNIHVDRFSIGHSSKCRLLKLKNRSFPKILEPYVYY